MTNETDTEQIEILEAELYFQKSQELAKMPEFRAYIRAKKRLIRTPEYVELSTLKNDLRERVLAKGESITTDKGSILFEAGDLTVTSPTVRFEFSSLGKSALPPQ